MDACRTCGSALAAVDTDEKTWIAPASGFEMTIPEAREILTEAGVDYLNIVPFEGREDVLPNKLYPTTYFVDENGIIFEDIASGAAVEQYPVTLEKSSEPVNLNMDGGPGIYRDHHPFLQSGFAADRERLTQKTF